MSATVNSNNTTTTTQCTVQAVRYALMQHIQDCSIVELEELVNQLFNAECYFDCDGQVAIQIPLSKLVGSVATWLRPN